MNTIRIFNNTAMLAGEVAIVDDCRYLVFMIQRGKLISTYLILDCYFLTFSFMCVIALKDISQTVHKGTLRNSEILKLGIKEHSTTDKQARNLQVL